MILELLLGLIVGFISGLSGIGGAPFIILGLSLFGFSQHSAQGTSLALMLAPLTIFAVIHLWKYIKKYTLYITISVIIYMLTSYVGAYFAYMFNDKILASLFSILLILIGLYSIFRYKFFSIEKTNKDITITSFIILSIFAGFLGGFFGIGAGVIIVPFLINVYHINKNEARAISLAILLPPVSIGAVLLYDSYNDIVWSAVLVLLIAYLISNYFGAVYGSKINDKHFNTLVGIILVLSGIINIAKGIL
jgi:uncharacterized membrane protein YfcA